MTDELARILAKRPDDESWITETKGALDPNGPVVPWRSLELQMQDRPLRYPLASGGNGDPWGLSQGVDRGWLNSYATPPDYMQRPPQDTRGGGELDMPTDDHAWRPMQRGWTAADPESRNVGDLRNRRGLMDWLDHVRMWLDEPAEGLYASGGRKKNQAPY